MIEYTNEHYLRYLPADDAGHLLGGQQADAAAIGRGGVCQREDGCGEHHGPDETACCAQSDETLQAGS